METKLTLYHGSNCNFSTVDLSKAKDKRDFVKGFYLTTLQNQAKDWAETLFARLGGEGVFVYEFELEIKENLTIKQFDRVSEDWLNFIRENRIGGGIQHNFDIVRGAVANDRTNRTLALFVEGIYTPKEAMRKLRNNKLNDQISIHTGKALICLKLINNKYTYKGQDITIDMIFKIEHIVNILAERENKDFDTVFADFLASETYRILQQTDNLLWAESSEFIVDEYDREKVELY